MVQAPGRRRAWIWTAGFLLALLGPVQGRSEPGGAPRSDAGLALTPVVTSGLQNPLFLTHAGDGSGRLFLVEQPGRVRLLNGGALAPVPFLDIADRVLSGGERGLLGLAFHPDYRTNGRFFVNYTRSPDGATVLAEYRRESPTVASREERVLMIVPQPYANHNGGMIAFGPDRLLYVGLGDGGSAGDPGNRPAVRPRAAPEQTASHVTG